MQAAAWAATRWRRSHGPAPRARRDRAGRLRRDPSPVVVGCAKMQTVRSGAFVAQPATPPLDDHVPCRHAPGRAASTRRARRRAALVARRACAGRGRGGGLPVVAGPGRRPLREPPRLAIRRKAPDVAALRRLARHRAGGCRRAAATRAPGAHGAAAGLDRRRFRSRCGRGRRGDRRCRRHARPPDAAFGRPVERRPPDRAVGGRHRHCPP